MKEPPLLSRRQVRFGLIGIFTVVAVIAACNYTPASIRNPSMLPLSPRLETLFGHTKTVCFGRYMIDVPVTATVVFGAAYVPAQFNRFPAQAEKLESEVSKEEEALKAETRYPTGSGLTLFDKTLAGAMPQQKIVIGWKTFSDPFYKVQSFQKLGSDLFITETEASPKDDEMHVESGMTVPQVLNTLNSMARSIRPRADDEVPTDVGVCIDGAFLPKPLDTGVEVIFFGVRLKEFPDVHLSIETRKMDSPLGEGQDLESLFERGRNAAILSGDGLAYARTNFFRRSARDLNGLVGHEILARKPAFKRDSEAHEFHFLYKGVPNDSLKPLIDIQMDTGVDGNRTAARPPSFTDEEALAVWDRLTGSIRLRPTPGPAKTSDAGPSPSPSPLGAVAASGRLCPASGWWECVEQTLPVQGGRRQFFREGDAFPEAILEAKASVWQKLTGEAPTYSVSTVWKLVEVAPPPR